MNKKKHYLDVEERGVQISFSRIIRDFYRKGYCFYNDQQPLDSTDALEVALLKGCERVQQKASQGVSAKDVQAEIETGSSFFIIESCYKAGCVLQKVRVPKGEQLPAGLKPLTEQEARWLYETEELYNLKDAEQPVDSVFYFAFYFYNKGLWATTGTPDGETGLVGAMNYKSFMEFTEEAVEHGDLPAGDIDFYRYLDVLEECGCVFHSRDFFAMLKMKTRNYCLTKDSSLQTK